MEYFGSFVALAAIPYFIGFITLCFWWRWWPLLALFTGWQYTGPLEGDGPGLAVGILLAFFTALGAGSGFIASSIVLIGRATTSRMLNPVVVLPSVFALGFGIPMLFYHAQAKQRDALFAPPPDTCFIKTYAAKLGELDLALPSAPGLAFLKMGSPRMYGLAHNPDVRSLCSEATAEAIQLRLLSLSLQGPSYARTPQASEFFCSRKHPQYPWAAMVCKAPNFNEPVINRPLSITLTTSDHVDWSTSERKRIGDHSPSIRSDGLTIYKSEGGMLLQRPDGYLANCSLIRNASYLSCSAKEKLTAELTISYQFNTLESDFLRATPLISSRARTFIQSLQR